MMEGPGGLIGRLRTGWRWWVSTLAGLLPSGLRDAFSDRGDRIVIETGTDELQVVRRSRAHETVVARIPRDEFAVRTLGLSVPKPSGLARYFGDPVILELPPDSALVRALRLPRAARRNLDGILRHEVGRQSPIGAENIYYDYRLTGGDAEAIDLDLRIVQRETVDDNLSLCRNAGIAISAVAFAGDAAAVAGGTFPVDGTASRRLALRRYLVPMFAALVVVLGFAFVASVYLRGAAEAADLEARVDDARAHAVAVERLQRRLDAATRQAAFLTQQKQAPATVAVLATVARLLPDDTWLYQFELNGREVRLHGFSAQAPALIGLFDSSPYFSDAEFRAPLMQGPTATLQRFDLSFKLRKGAS
jgi:general secretion pathway protein L